MSSLKYFSRRDNRHVFIALIVLLFPISGWAFNGTVDSEMSATNQDSLRAKEMKDLSYKLVWTNPDSAIIVAQELADFGEKKSNVKWRVDGLRRMGMAYEAKAEFDSALKHYSQGMTLRESSGDPNLRAIGIGDLAGLAASQGRNNEAITFYNEQLSIWSELKDSTGLSNAYNNIGIVHFRLGDVRNAIDSYTKSMHIDEMLGDIHSKHATMVNVAQLHHRIGNNHKALDMLYEVKEYFEKVEPDVDLYTIASSLGAVYSDMGEYSKAIDKFEEAIEMADSVNNPLYRARALMNIGLVHLRTGQLERAIEELERALTFHEDIDDVQGIAITLSNLGEAYLRSERISDAIAVSKRGIEYHETHGNLVEARESYGILAQCYKHRGDDGKAYYALEKYQSLRDSLEEDEKEALLLDKEYELKYELKATSDSLQLAYQNQLVIDEERFKHERSTERLLFGGIGLLVLLSILGIVARIYQKRKRLKAEFLMKTHELNSAKSEMKALRSQMNPHFIFNAMRSVQHFIHDGKPEDAKKYLEDFSRLIRSVLENSMDDEVTLAKDIETLKLYLKLEGLRPNNPFTYEIEIDEEVDMDFDTIPPLLLQPIVENSLEHGFIPKQGPGHLVITISKENGNLKCVVEDDGVGRASQTENEQSYSLKGKSLGLSITKQRLQVRDNRTRTKSDITTTDLTTTDGLSAGTRVEINIPQAA